MEQAEYFQFLEEYHKQMLVQHISEDTQPPSLRSCAGNFPVREFPWAMTVPDSSQDGILWERQIPNSGSINFCQPLEHLHPGKHTDLGEDHLPTGGFYAEQTHTWDKVPCKLWGKLWIFTLKGVNQKGWMFLHPWIAACLLWILWKQCWVKWRFTENTKTSVDGANNPDMALPEFIPKWSIPRASVMPGKDRAHSSAPA